MNFDFEISSADCMYRKEFQHFTQVVLRNKRTQTQSIPDVSNTKITSDIKEHSVSTFSGLINLFNSCFLKFLISQKKNFLEPEN